MSRAILIPLETLWPQIQNLFFKSVSIFRVQKEVVSGPVARDMSGLFEYRDPPSLDDLVIKAGPPVNVNEEDYPEFDLDDLF